MQTKPLGHASLHNFEILIYFTDSVLHLSFSQLLWVSVTWLCPIFLGILHAAAYQLYFMDNNTTTQVKRNYKIFVSKASICPQ